MNIENLHLFKTLAEKLHYKKTSIHHHVTVSTLTRVIQRLEKELGVKLFERNNRRVLLTANGKIVYHFATDILHRHNELTHHLHPTKKEDIY